MKTSYSVKDLTLKKGVILVTLKNIKPKQKSGLILPGQEDNKQIYLNDFPDHPFQAIVSAVGSGIQEHFPEGLKIGQIVYLDRAPNPDTDFVNIGGLIYARIYVNTIFAVKDSIDDIIETKGDA